MIRLTLPTRIQLLDAIPRIFWAVLLTLHLPILVAVVSRVVMDGVSFSGAGSVIALLLAIALFVLKLMDCRYLRLRARRQSFVAVCLLTAIVHGGALAPTTGEADRMPIAVVLVTAAVIGVAAKVIRSLGERILDGLELLVALLATRASRLIQSVSGEFEPESPLARLIAASIRIPRAPPS